MKKRSLTKSGRAPSRRGAALAGLLLLAFVGVERFLRWTPAVARKEKPAAAPAAGPEAASAVPAAPPVLDGAEAIRARKELESLRDAMLRYRRDVGELPPRGNYCAVCMVVRDGKPTYTAPTPAEPRPHMDELETALMNPDGAGWNGPYRRFPIPRDPWGREYTYDDNDPNGSNPGDTSVFSAGPDGIYGSDDDIEVLVLSERDGRLPLGEWRRKISLK